jgi:hypothetical protein
MNPRERILAILLGCVIILGGAGFFGYQFAYVPWSMRTKNLENLKKDETTKQNRLAEIELHRAELARLRMLSLPGDPEVARREYERYLNELLAHHGVAAGHYTIAAKPLDKQTVPTVGPNKDPIYTKLTFTVQADATMGSLVGVLEDFYKTGLLQEIKSVSVQRQLTNTDATRANELTVHMTIEALIVTGADKRTYLLPNIPRRLLALDMAATLVGAPTGLGLAIWSAGPTGPAGPGLLAGRRMEPAPADSAVEEMFTDAPRYYDAIAKKNVFLGRPPVDQEGGSPEWMAPHFVRLTGIAPDSRDRMQAFLFDVSINRLTRLRSTTGFDQFTFIKDGEPKAVVRGTIVKIADRDVVFRAELAAEDASPGRDPKAKGFFHLDRKSREKLIADGLIKSEEAGTIYRVERSYWDSLVKSLIIRERGRDSFRIQLEKDSDKPVEGGDSEEMGPRGNPVDVLSGRIVRSDGSELLVQVESRYFNLHIGQCLDEALKKPLGRDQLKELKIAAN